MAQFPPPKSVLMTADAIGGVWAYALDLAKALESSNISVSLAVMGSRLSSKQRESAHKISNLDIYESTYRLEWMKNPWDEVRKAGEWLLQLESDIHPDLIHLNNYCHGSLPWNSPSLVVGHSCVYSWYESVRVHRPFSEWRRYHTEVSRGLRHANLVTAPTRHMLACLRSHYGYFFTLGPIYNGHTSHPAYPKTKEPVILTTGRLWDEAKNILTLEQAADRISWPIYAAGSNQHPDGGIVELKKIRWLGYLETESLREWQSRASIFALPALYEPFGLSALEAALAGCALVLGDIPYQREVWGNAAIFVPPRDPKALADAINRLSADQFLRELYAYRALTRALQYSPQRMAHEYLVAYRHILRDHQLNFIHKVM